MASKVDQELARIEARQAEAEASKPPKRGLRAGIKRYGKELILRRHSTKR